jgi:tripartite-type tricarboxylate transporter receptor subunit TctC
MHLSLTKAAMVIAASLSAAAMPAVAADGVSFKGKTITMIIPTTPGGSTDLSARLFVRFFGDYLPGKPSVVAQNVPGGHGVTALNYMAQQVTPDGMTITMSSNSQVDPMTYRAPQVKYDPLKFQIIGSVGIGHNVMIIRTDALPRLLDKSKPPVAMGSVSGAPRSGMRMNMWGKEFLGWNTKWVVGYPGSTDLLVAIERGELDMTSFPSNYVIDRLNDQTKYKVIYQDGLVAHPEPSGRADSDNAPLFTKAMEGKITDPKMKAAYDYWRASTLFKWLALPPKTPDAIRDVYRAAFLKITADPQFKAQAKDALEGYTVNSPEETERMIHDLAITSDEALATTDELMRKQGITVASSGSTAKSKSKGKSKP